MTWRTYGMIIISSGISVGGVLWYGSRSAAVRGEYRAELSAASAERTTLTYEGEFFDWRTNDYNAVGEAVSKAWFEGLQQQVIDCALYVAQTNGMSAYWCASASVPEGKIWTIAGADVRLRNYKYAGYPFWGTTAPTNTFTDVICAPDRVYAAGQNYTTSEWPDQLTAVDRYYPPSGYSRDPAPVGGSNTWWSYIGMSTNLYAFDYPGRAITTNELNELACVLTNMDCTVVFAPVSALQFDSCRTGNYATNFYHLRDDDDWHGVGTGDLLALINNNVNDFREFSYPATWNGVLSLVSVLGAYDSAREQRWSGGGWIDAGAYSEVTAYIDAQHTELRNASFAYPCAYAFTAKYVARYRVYAVATASPGSRGNKAQFVEDYRTITTGDATQPDHYQDKLFGVLSAVCSLPADQTVPASDDDGIHVIAAMGWPASYTQIIASRLIDLNHPSSRPRFNLGNYGAAVELSEANSMVSADSAETLVPGDRWYQDERVFLDFKNTVTVRGFIIAINWEWQHLNLAAPYAPAPYTPPWTIKE